MLLSVLDQFLATFLLLTCVLAVSEQAGAYLTAYSGSEEKILRSFILNAISLLERHLVFLCLRVKN
jgi:hypothetical protein